MALTTTLDMLQRAADELGLDRPVSVAGADAQTRQLHASLNATGRDLMRGHDWSALQAGATVLTVAAQADYPLPADHHRMVPDTGWDEGGRRRLGGPHTPQAEASGRAGVAARSFRQAGTRLRLLPAPASGGETLSFLYVSKLWARAASGIPREETESDTDTTVFAPDLLVKGTKWRFMAAKGMYADALRKEWEELRDREIAADLGGTVLTLASGRDEACPAGLDAVADGGWAL